MPLPTFKAWDLIGYDGTPESVHDVPGLPEHGAVRLQGGRTLYESVGNEGGARVRLSRLDTSNGLRGVTRYVDADALLEVVDQLKYI